MLLFMEVEFPFDGGGRHRNILNVVWLNIIFWIFIYAFCSINLQTVTW